MKLPVNLAAEKEFVAVCLSTVELSSDSGFCNAFLSRFSERF
jgi:hypothetical protein